MSLKFTTDEIEGGWELGFLSCFCWTTGSVVHMTTRPMMGLTWMAKPIKEFPYILFSTLRKALIIETLITNTQWGFSKTYNEKLIFYDGKEIASEGF